jgi:hypothetical protein
MQRVPTLRALLLLSLSAALAGCPGPEPEADTGGGSDAGPTSDTPGADASGSDAPVGRDAPVPDTVPILRNPLPSETDANLAMMSLRIMGAPESGSTRVLCNDCHDLTRAQIRYWATATIAASTGCVADPTLAGGDAAATEVVNCIRGGEAGRYNPDNLGIFSTAADLDWFRYVFANGAGASWETEHSTFLDEAGMPRDYPSLTQPEFDVLAEWFLRGAPMADSILPAETRPTECVPEVNPDVAAYVAERETNSWTTANAAAGMLMYGCAGATNALGCLADETLASSTTYGANWDDVTTPDAIAGTTNRVLFELDYTSAYWTRSSSDGRFVSNGATRAPNLRFIDLAGGGTGPLTGRVIGGSASYDPFFFPDDSGFLVQGSGPRVCEMRVLTTGTPTMLSFREAGCSSGGAIDLYEHLGASLGGGDYWAIDSVGAGMYAEYDPGSLSTRTNPEASFSSSARSTVRFLTNDGSAFSVGGSATVTHPYEGDAVISPALGLILTRQAGASGQLGFVLRRVSVSGSGASRTISTVPVGRYCINGGKPGFSYDERFAVLHHYIENTDADARMLGFTGASDPGFAPYRTNGGANIYLVEFATGDIHRVTNMAPGQFALFPHFRSDGWIYYLERSGTGPEHVVANDAALRLP